MSTAQIDSLRASFNVNSPQWGCPQPYQHQSTAWSAQAPVYPTLYYPPQPQQQSVPAEQSNYQTLCQSGRAWGNHNAGSEGYNSGNAQLSNPYINSTRAFSQGSGVYVCIRCGEDGHISRNCTNAAVLRRFPESTMTGTGPPTSATISGTQPAIPPTVDAHSITYDMAGLQTTSGKVHSAEAFLGEGSGPNKRPHVEEAISPTVPLTPRPLIQPTAFQPGPSTGQGFVFTGAPAQNESERPKKKGQKCTGKAATIAPLVGLIDEETGYVDKPTSVRFVNKPTSVRQLLKSQKIDMTWMDFCV